MAQTGHPAEGAMAGEGAVFSSGARAGVSSGGGTSRVSSVGSTSGVSLGGGTSGVSFGGGTSGVSSVKPRRVKILDYFSMIESNSEKCQAQTEEGRRDAIRATCNFCRRPISGTYRVKSNFITHLRKSHPNIYLDYHMKSGRRQSYGSGGNNGKASRATTLSIASLNDSTLNMTGYTARNLQYTSGLDQFRSVVPRRYLPTSSVMDSNIDRSSCYDDVRLVKSEPEEVAKHDSALGASFLRSTINEALVDFITGDLLPTALLESSRFAAFLHLLNPGYKIPSPSEFQRLVGERITLRKTQLSSQLRSVRAISLSQEVWETETLGAGLVTLTAHYIENWACQHRLLSARQLDARLAQDKDWWSAFQQTTLSDYGIATDAVLITVNRLMSVQHLPGFTGVDAVAASSGRCNTTPPVGQPGYAMLLDETVVSALTRSGAPVLEAMQLIAEILATPGIDWDRDVSDPSTLPWFEQLHLVDMVVSMGEPLKSRVAQLADRCLTADQVCLVSNVVEVLRPFQEIAGRLRSSNSVTGSLAFASTKLLKAAFCDMSEAFPDLSLVSELRREFGTLTASIDSGEGNAYTTATILDPRFKLQWCEENNFEYFKTSFIEVAKKFLTSQVGAPRYLQSDSPGQLMSPPPLPSNGFFTRILKQQPESVQAGSVTSEALRYLAEPLMLEDCDILSYWQANELNFPHLSALARSYLTIPTSPSNVVKLCHLSTEISEARAKTLSTGALQNFIELGAAHHQ